MSRIALICANFYPEITDQLHGGAAQYLYAKGLRQVERIDLPGAFEIPGAIAMLHTQMKADGYIALGCVVRGETSHYDHVCNETMRGLMHLSVEKFVPIGNGILTCNDRAQAWARASRDQGNKGEAAAIACLEMIKMKSDMLHDNV